MSASDILAPTTTDELCETLMSCASRGAAMEIGGAFSKQTMGGPLAVAEARVSTARMTRLLAYEPADLTMSVEAGMPWRELNRILDENHQFVPIDPAYGALATVGGVVAADCSGPRRRRYGTARDMTIGMSFATIEGKLIRSGGMVVKNVTGLDMAKLLIGSFGTLAAIATVNFKVLPKPVAKGSFVFSSDDLAAVVKVRRRMLASQLQPVALDLLAGSRVTKTAGDRRYRLVSEVHGNESMVARYGREYAMFAQKAGVEFMVLSGETESLLWNDVREFSSNWMEVHPNGGVLRLSSPPALIGETLAVCEGSSVTRSTAGVTYLGCANADDLKVQLGSLRSKGIKTLVEHASPAEKVNLEQWANPDGSLAIMKRIKTELDTQGLLNPGRLFGRI